MCNFGAFTSVNFLNFPGQLQKPTAKDAKCNFSGPSRRPLTLKYQPALKTLAEAPFKLKSLKSVKHAAGS